MKKLLAYLFAVLMMFSMAGCGEEPVPPTAPQTGGSAGQGTAPVTTAPQADPKAILGTLEGTTYTNQVAGLICQLPDAFTYSTAEELLTKNGLDAQEGQDALLAMAGNHQPVHVMYAMNPQTKENIVVTVQRATEAELAAMDIQADFQAQIPGEISSYEQMGLTNVQCKYTQLTVSEKPLDALVLTGDYSGQQIASVTGAYKTNTCLVTLTLAGTDVQSLEQLLASIVVA